jgi:broad-specificity NMP kinase
MRFACRMGCVFGFLLIVLYPQAQSGVNHFKIAVFAPLYLDQVFDGDNLKSGNNAGLPKNMLPGLEFYNGVMMAIDSLQAEDLQGISIEINVYDTKGVFESISNIISEDQLNDVSLIIASFNDKTEIKPLAAFALEKRIPLLSSTYPNDGGVTNNPYFILINSSLRTHLEELYRFIQRNYSTSNIVLFRKKGSVEDMIQSVFGEMGKSTPSIPLKMKTIELSENFTDRNVLDFLDSTKKNTVICGTINEEFGLRLIRVLSSDPAHAATIIGMPTWDSFKILDNIDYKGVEVVYSTPYNFSKSNKISIHLTREYRTKFLARPSDMVFKGFESMYHFTKLLQEHQTNLTSFLSDKKYKLFNDFDIRTVRNKTTHNIDYLENKKLYFVKKVSGTVKAIY